MFRKVLSLVKQLKKINQTLSWAYCQMVSNSRNAGSVSAAVGTFMWNKPIVSDSIWGIPKFKYSPRINKEVQFSLL